MLLWMAQAVMNVVLCASSVSMFWKLPILMVPPRLAACAVRHRRHAERQPGRQAGCAEAERLQHRATGHRIFRPGALAQLAVDFLEPITTLHVDPPPSV